MNALSSDAAPNAPASLAPTAPATPAYFDALFAASDDPWRFRTSWYEARKRALTLACLPAAHYGSIYEPGCANGALSAALAPRCERLQVSDAAPAAVVLARERLAPFAHATVRHASIPDDWPVERFDLVVLSEVGYYLSPEALDRFAERTRASLAEGGTVLACHWRWPIAEAWQSGDRVHEQLGAALGLASVSSVVERDFRIDVWCADDRSVGEREGLAERAPPGTER